METIMKVLMVFLLAPFVILGGVAVSIVIDLLLAFPLMWAWNYALPTLFGLPQVSYWQAFCLLIVSTLLVKSQTVNNSSK